MSRLMDELKKAEQPRSGSARPAMIAADAAALSKLATALPDFPPASSSATVFSKPKRRIPAVFTVLLLLIALGVALYAGSRQMEKNTSAVASAVKPVAQTVQQAHTALQQGDLKAAYMAFQNILATEPNNRAALHGLAEIALSQNQEALANNYWQRALQADPQDLRAELGLIGLLARQQPQAAETRLQALLTRQAEAESAPLHYALGNLYASQSRWPEAQTAFLQAYRHEPENPDYLFNLAVSFESLHQSQQARHFYQLAVDAAGRQPAHFDVQQAQRRLAELR